jgi:MoaA/NifB/PqqE/SkfB family radical SAM enzyme
VLAVKPYTLRQSLNRTLAHYSNGWQRTLVVHRPVHVFLQVASACNLDCYMCSEHNREPENRHGVGLVSLERQICDKLADEVFTYTAVLTIGVGGEPTQCPKFS